MAYKALTVAKYMMFRYPKADTGVSWTNLRLQKTLYFLQYESLKLRNDIFFADSIEAWRYGPVVPIVYQYFVTFGNNVIDMSNEDLAEGAKIAEKIAKCDKDLIQDIVTRCTKHDVFDLVAITKRQFVWLEAYNSYEQTMSVERIKEQILKK